MAWLRRRHQRSRRVPVNHPVIQAKPDRIREQNEPDPGRVAHTRQEAGSNDFLAVGPALRMLQLNEEGLSVTAKRSIIRHIAHIH